MERNLLIKLAYNGAGYHGWQIQENALTVQEVFQKALYRITGESVDIKACSRTDTGVHAREFCLSFKSRTQIAENRLVAALNHGLPLDVVVHDCFEVPMEFHARYDCLGKEYTYEIWNDPIRDPFLKDRALHYWYHLDEDMLNLSAKNFIGTHDFTSFCTLDRRDNSDFVRTIQEARVERIGSKVVFTVRGDGFLYNMVRIMTGTLLLIQQKKLDLDEIPSIIEKRNREAAGPTAPARGLYLNHVSYSSETLQLKNRLTNIVN